jgi:hypothetical protein
VVRAVKRIGRTGTGDKGPQLDEQGLDRRKRELRIARCLGDSSAMTFVRQLEGE